MDGLEKTGNWREIQPLTQDHNPVVLFSNEGAAASGGGTYGQTSYIQQGAFNVANNGILSNSALMGGNALMGRVVYGPQP